MYENGKWILNPDNASEPLNLVICARFGGQIEEILSINITIKKKE